MLAIQPMSAKQELCNSVVKKDSLIEICSETDTNIWYSRGRHQQIPAGSEYSA
jgi:hypothetical protein